jgi:hypothetical protein
MTSRFLKRKMEEYDALKAEIEALKIEADTEKFAREHEEHDQCPIGHLFQGRPTK